MTFSAERRPVDWQVIQPNPAPVPTRAASSAAVPTFAALAEEVIAAPSPSTLSRMLSNAVEFARTVIGLERTAIYVYDERNQIMVGTFGTDAERKTVDEHALTYQFGTWDREIFSRAEEGLPWTVYENCPQIAQRDGVTRILSHGWVAGTAIRGQRGPLAIFFNDTALSGAPLDEGKQLQLAVLCALLGRALEPCRGFLVERSAAQTTRKGIADRVTECLTRDPSLSCDALGRQLGLSPRRLARAFKSEAKVSLVDFRNELRLTRFFETLASVQNNLLEAALAAGFGSYAQFHRVFRARFGRCPREYLISART